MTLKEKSKKTSTFSLDKATWNCYNKEGVFSQIFLPHLTAKRKVTTALKQLKALPGLILTHNIHKRVFVYTLGLFILAIGIVLAVQSGLGISPMTSFPVILSQILGTGLGITVTSVFLCFVAAQKLLYGKAFHWSNISQVAFAFLFGFFVDFAEWLIGDFSLPTYLGQLFLLFLSIIIIAYGLAIYMEAKLVNLPAEGFVMAVSDKINFPFSRGKIMMDCIFVAIGVLLSLLFIGGVWGIREGTILSAIFVGKSIPFAAKTSRFFFVKVGLLSMD